MQEGSGGRARGPVSVQAFGVQLGVRVWGLGFGVWGLGLGVRGLRLGFGVWGLVFRKPPNKTQQ